MHHIYTELKKHFEGDTQGVRVRDVLTLSDAEMNLLRERITQSNGEADILVHPYFHEDDPESKRGPSPSYQEARDTFIGHALSTSSTPLIIFEEASQRPLLAGRIKNARGELYTVVTQTEKPVPHVLDENQMPHADNVAWSKVKEVFESLGIKHVTVGGRYMEFAGLEDSEGITDLDAVSRFEELKEVAKGKPYALEWINKGIFPFGCAGQAAQQLIREGFDVSLSSVSSPDVYSSNPE